jgi:ribonuclease HI
MYIPAIVANASRAKKPPRDVMDRWEKQSLQQLKLNVDAAFHPDVFSGAVGAVIRDYQGHYITASYKFLPHVASAATVEAMAMKEGLMMASSRGFDAIIVEADSTKTIEACSGAGIWWTESTAVYAVCINYATTIGDVQYKSCPREANQVAHEIARFYFSNNISCNWVDELPSFILDRLINDATEL